MNNIRQSTALLKRPYWRHSTLLATFVFWMQIIDQCFYHSLLL